MTVAPNLLTFEEYLAEGEVNRRYDILDGVRREMTNPTRRHQDVAGNIYELLRAYQRAYGRGRAFFAPCDVLIRHSPLRTRQPDVLFISNEQLAKCGTEDDPAPLYAAPELVVEILSPSETRRMRDEKIEDYRSIGVRECWVVSLDRQEVEVIRLAWEGVQSVATCEMGDACDSAVFSDLAIAVQDIFAS